MSEMSIALDKQKSATRRAPSPNPGNAPHGSHVVPVAFGDDHARLRRLYLFRTNTGLTGREAIIGNPITLDALDDANVELKRFNLYGDLPSHSISSARHGLSVCGNLKLRAL